MPFETTGLNRQQLVRVFLQPGGPRVASPLKYYGLNTQYLFVQGLTKSYGSVNPIYLPAAQRPGSYDLITRTRDAPDLPEASLQQLQKLGTVPRDLGEQGCPANLYLVTSGCGGDLSDPINGWDGFVEILSNALAEENDGGDRMSMDSDDANMDEYTLKLTALYKAGALSFGEQAAAAIDREVLDVAYGNGASCGTCGPADDGTRRLYAITAASGAGSPGLPAQVVYVERNPVTGDVTVREYDITGLTATVSPTFIDIMGPYLVVGVSTNNAYFYATIDSVTGIPGTFTQVTTGFVATKTPNDIWVKSSTEAYIAANGGYVYRITDVPSGVTAVSAGATTVQNLTRIHGVAEAIVAVGAAATVLRSTNGGASWAAVTSAPGAAALSGVFVLSQSYIQVVNASGVHYTTETGGASWTSRTISGATACQDIVYATEECGYILYTTSTGAAMQATTYGGAAWYDTQTTNSRLKDWPTLTRANRLAVPRSSGPQTAANTVAVGGVATSGSNADGILTIGLAAFV